MLVTKLDGSWVSWIHSLLVKYRLIFGFTWNLVVLRMRCYSFQNLCGTETEREATKLYHESSTWAAGGCFATAAVGRIDPFCPCAYMCWCDAHMSLYQLLDFAFCVFLGSGVDYPSDCSSWLQRLGLAKSKVGRSSSSGPDKAPSFHRPDAVNSSGGDPLPFFVWLHLGISTSRNKYDPWKGEWGG